MDNAAVAHINLWRLDQPFSHVAMPRGQAAHEQEVHQQVEITGGGLAIHAQSARQLSGVEPLRLVMRQHGPETPQGFGGYPGAELRNVPLQISPDKVPPPFHAEIVVVGEETARKSAANPKPVELIRGNLERIERAKLQIGDATGQAFA